MNSNMNLHYRSFFKKLDKADDDESEPIVKAQTKRKNPFDSDTESPEKKRTSNGQTESKENPPKDVISDKVTTCTKLKITSAGEGKKGADFDPSKKNYHPIKDSFWNLNEKYVFFITIKIKK